MQANISKVFAVRWTMKGKHKTNLLERKYLMQTHWWALPLRQCAREMPQALPWDALGDEQKQLLTIWTSKCKVPCKKLHKGIYSTVRSHTLH